MPSTRKCVLYVLPSICTQVQPHPRPVQRALLHQLTLNYHSDPTIRISSPSTHRTNCCRNNNRTSGRFFNTTMMYSTRKLACIRSLAAPFRRSFIRDHHFHLSERADALCTAIRTSKFSKVVSTSCTMKEFSPVQKKSGLLWNT